MLEVSSPIGNIADEGFGPEDENFETIEVSRIELEKRILRRKTNRGTDVGLNLKPGVKLHHGDVFESGDRKIIIEQMPEKVIAVKIKSKHNIDVMILLGHIIGNMHRPVSIKDETILFPIQADSEKELFTRLFHSIISHIEITVKEQRFIPHFGANIHEH